MNPIPESGIESSSPEEDPVHIPVLVKKMETLRAKKEDLEMSELARRFEKIDTQEQVRGRENFFLTILAIVTKLLTPSPICRRLDVILGTFLTPYPIYFKYNLMPGTYGAFK